MQTELDKYNHSLDLALMDFVIGKTEKFDAHCAAFNLTDKIPTNPLAKSGAVMKMITARTNLPMWARKEAKRWLADRGFQSWDDGDVPSSPLTAEQAISMLPDGDSIHTFRSGPGILIGANWDRNELEQAIRENSCEVGGDQCQAMNHGLVVWTGRDPLFVECRKDIDYEQFAVISST